MENLQEEKLFINGKWVKGGEVLSVTNKYDGTIIGKVYSSTLENIDKAITAAYSNVNIMARIPAHKRSEILLKTANLITEQKESLAKTIAKESGKALKYSRLEVDRAASTFITAAEEAKRIHGETIPFDAISQGEGYFGFWMRRPVGVVLAITPFNFPLNLVAHKVAPAIAAGNTIILKPATSTPLSSIALCRILQEAGLPNGAINLVFGKGSKIGDSLIIDPRISKITFTGSASVGQNIIAKAGIKKVTMELGNNSPVIICPDADLEFAANRCAIGAFYNSGQVCVSVQRIYAHRYIYEQFTTKIVEATEKLKVGNPLDETTDIGPMIDLNEVKRITEWVEEARSDGAIVQTGGKNEGALFWPTILTETKPSMKIISEEAFAPVVSIVPYDNFEDAVNMADSTNYGLQAAIFTRDINRILYGMKMLNFGGIIVNDTPSFRADHMPYGGNRQSGIGREGIKFAIEEMTNMQTIAIRTEQ